MSDEPRYFITEPVDGGDRWYNVRDREDAYMPNRPLASFAADLPGARGWAESVLEDLIDRKER